MEFFNEKDYHICQLHKNYCNLVCLHRECIFIPLCNDCISRHEKSHISEIVSIDKVLKKNMVMPSLISNYFSKFKQTLFNLQAQVNNTKLENIKFFLFFCDNLQTIFTQSIINFKDQGRKIIETQYKDFPIEIDKILQKISYYESGFNPTLFSPYNSPQRVENSIKFNAQLKQTFFIELEKDVKKIEENLNYSKITINEDRTRKEFDTLLQAVFNKKLIFTINKPYRSKVTKSDLHKSDVFPKIDQIPYNENLNLNSSLIEKNERTSKLPHIKQYSSLSNFNNAKLLGYHSDIINSVCLITEYGWLASAGGDHIIKIWDIDTYNLIKELKGHHSDIWDLFYYNIENVLFSSSSDRSIKIWDIDDGICLKTLLGHLNVVRTLAFSKSEKILFSGGSDELIKSWDIYAGICIHTFHGHSNIVRTICVHDKKKEIITGGGDGTIKIFDFSNSMRNLEVLSGHPGEIWSIILMEDINLFASAGTDKIIRIWDLNNFKLIKMLSGHENTVNKLVYLKDGRRIVSGGSDNSVRLWNVHNGKVIRVYREHENIVCGLDYSKDILVTGSWDQTVKIWSIYE